MVGEQQPTLCNVSQRTLPACDGDSGSCASRGSLPGTGFRLGLCNCRLPSGPNLLAIANLAQELDRKFFSILIGPLLTGSLIEHSLMLSLSYIGEDYMHSITGPEWLGF